MPVALGIFSAFALKLTTAWEGVEVSACDPLIDLGDHAVYFLPAPRRAAMTVGSRWT